MTRKVGVYQARTRFSRLLRQVEAGEEVLILRGRRPVARLVPVAEPRRPGTAAGRLWMADDWDAPLPEEILQAFEGNES